MDDARLVIANARAAADLGATVLTRTACVTAHREGAHWRATLQPQNAAVFNVVSRAIVNVTGPWAKQFVSKNLGLSTPFGLKLVKGSHIVVPRLYAGEHAFILQNRDQRVVFVYPYESHYTIIGTTDVEHSGEPGDCVVSTDEIMYLCQAANRYFAREIAPKDVVWRYCGVRPLFDDGAQSVSKITRDYTLRVDRDGNSAPILSVFGGKITTYRKLAEHALEKLIDWFPEMQGPWTAQTPLSGGALAGLSLDDYTQQLIEQHPQLPLALICALVRRHGDAAPKVLSGVNTSSELGEHFGHTLYAREVDYFIAREWALTTEDVLWRRTKAGLHLNSQQKQSLVNYFTLRRQSNMR